ncbi:MAG: FAD-dependent oxidoreductase [Pseudomonas sp. PGPPP4]|uniref:NAD(P)/FAD-dependent oxidoreductase n=1 Tax=Pseudomonas TaxID=286 RepID=UPI000BD32A7E|nr:MULTISPECIES: FAD-dependent oxidoreductase [Pseudomonas]MCI1009950.1 FAD-binding oxidoreductase [Pseudomonas oryzihabitans]OYT83169.1 MAG: FAD-dependent oxidoreductase [Pseudomonas sp. PGPPP4]
MSAAFDFVVVGGGIGGVAVAYELSQHGRVCLLERENVLAYHTTGRSAAISMESYGNRHIRALTCASRAFFEQPTAGLTNVPLCSPRGALIVATEAREAQLRQRFAAVVEQVPSVRLLDRQQVLKLAPYLSAQRWAAGIYEPSAFDLDVHAIHAAFLMGLRRNGGEVRRNAELLAGKRLDGQWQLTITGGVLHAGVVINAAGSWADECASRCGVPGIRMQALRRTVLTVEASCELQHTPYLGTLDEDIFIKPEAGRLIVSPCDETPSEPCDAAPDEFDLAVTMERLEQATVLRPKRIVNRWAGLRNFVADRTPVLGTDPEAEGFVWFAALGGYGIQTAPAAAQLCSALARQAALPPALVAAGLSPLPFSPARCRDGQLPTQSLKPVAQLQ